MLPQCVLGLQSLMREERRRWWLAMDNSAQEECVSPH